jgi:excinuclease ABC subunit B
VDPQPLRKKIADITDLINRESDDTDELLASGRKSKSAGAPPIGLRSKNVGSLPRQELVALIESLTDQMRSAAAELSFELAARLRDEIRDLKKELRAMQEAGH